MNCDYIVLKDAIESAGVIVCMICVAIFTFHAVVWMNKNSK